VVAFVRGSIHRCAHAQWQVAITFLERSAMNYEFTVTGMTCGHCEKAVTKALQSQDPQAQVLIERDQNRVQVQSTLEREVLRQAIVEEGYAVAP
jgi:copper chaperone